MPLSAYPKHKKEKKKHKNIRLLTCVVVMVSLLFRFMQLHRRSVLMLEVTSSRHFFNIYIIYCLLNGTKSNNWFQVLSSCWNKKICWVVFFFLNDSFMVSVPLLLHKNGI